MKKQRQLPYPWIAFWFACGLFFGAVAAFGGYKMFHLPPDIPRPLILGALTIPPEPPPEFQPEIPVNEYWDYAQIQGLHLYVNNTDRSVIYALDDKGKIVWTFWAKDQGFNGFEIFRGGKYLFLKTSMDDVLDQYFERILILGLDGKVRVNQTFEGYVDLPKLLVMESQDIAVLENRSGGICDQGGGILTQGKPEEYCSAGALWAFDLKNGRLLWKNATRTFYPYIQEELPDGRIKSYSSGVGPGRWAHTWVVSSTTGVIEEHQARVNDLENAQAPGVLTLDENKQTISFDGAGTGTAWTLPSTHPLYSIIADQGQKKGLIIRVLDDIILANLGGEGDWTTYAIDKTNGDIKWKKDFASQNWESMDWQSHKGVLIFKQAYRSSCEDICRTCPKYSWICADIAPPKECASCREKEQDDPTYANNKVLGVDAASGKGLWEVVSKKGTIVISGYRGIAREITDAIGIDVYTGNDQEHLDLDIKTGKANK